MGLSKQQVERYARQLIVPEVGVRGQQQLFQASVLIIGAGGLGSPASLYLAGAGVGRLGIIDSDVVSLGNLHRQIVHATQHVGQPKVASAAQRITQLNPDVVVEPIHDRLRPAMAQELCQRYDLMVDGSDNFPTRYLANDVAVVLGKPLVHAGAIHVGGQVLTVLPRQGACLRCVFPEPPLPDAIPTCQAAGVLGSVAGVVGTLMAHEALKLLLGIGEPLVNRFLIIEGAASRFREVALRRDPACAVCGDHPTIRDILADNPDYQSSPAPAEVCSGLAV